MKLRQNNPSYLRTRVDKQLEDKESNLDIMPQYGRIGIIGNRKGQALSEYALIGLLIGVIGIAGLAALGNAVRGAFQGMLISEPPQTKIVTTASKPPPSAPEVLPAPPPAIPPPLPASVSGVSITTSTGTKIALPNYPDSVSKVVSISGANGATDLMADTLTTIAKQLAATGEIDAAQYNTLIALANQGHKLGSLEKSLEDAAAQATSSAEYAKMKISFDGKTYSPKVLSDDQGFATNSQDASKVKNPLDTRSALGETAAFLKLYDKVQNNGSLSDPAIRQIVTSLSSQIAYLSEAAVSNTYKAANGDISVDAVRDSIVSDMTHADSSGICQIGQGKDSGIQCAG
jgi:Flp pilus assembly pilin Flp